MLTVNQLTIKTLKDRILIDHLSFTCTAGDKIAVIGEEGNGKSTLFKAIWNPDLISEYTVMEGHIDCRQAVIGYLPQALDVRWYESSGLDFCMRETPSEIPDYEKIGELYLELEKVGADAALLERKMEQLSGGEKVKLQLAKLRLKEPDLILMDEPTNDLDLETLDVLEQFILKSRAAILFVSHDETLLEHCANGILHLEQIVRKTQARHTFVHLGYRDYVLQREALANRQNQLSVKEHQEHAQQMERYRRLYQSVDHALNSVSRQQPHAAKMLKRKMHSVKALGERLEEKPLTHKFEGEEQIELFFDPEVRIANSRKQILDFHLPQLWAGAHLCAHDVHLQIVGPQKIAIIGPNGCGKTTLLRLIWEQLKDRKDLRVGYMPQNYEERLPLSLNPIDYLSEGQDQAFRTRIQNHLGSLKFTPEEMRQPMEAFSSGQKAKILLVKLVVDHNDVLLLDEPTRNLSPLSAGLIRAQLAGFPGCLIAVSHDRRFIAEAAQRIVRLTPQGLEEDSWIEF
ncbi:ATP-binding cassette domain-containing protein [Holdemania massiliensis]|uniref:ATP-binding cassette domain-containing protein n=1 Tax=Holdemania massiliensis TaxID=1468449 RepID=A0A6N7S8Q2_9FIRM|nr:ATP-binding cassette domain-containing protein [Holdemania massiliensis]MSA71669.1 ATP-binding cassette domain-containing protein [Holdemania massiliensis]MSA89918.1 ATP-binding cassette domain-containing protein [Holdemania massiliensis]MSB78826.1 ATP-binding cassette domain-containing protein [Holdemania massiliensis]MSC33673.1 ATP-binding cassette domain-containing protein [Holdemania massiliensis]MSC40028.1 ATP-binding cassette domain-containing protein [Holdemania massiliensis]